MKITCSLAHLILLTTILTVTFSCKKESDNLVYDDDNNAYHTVTIGTQTWMLENLKTTKYNDGTSIQLLTDQREWAFLNSSGYCFYNNDKSHIEKYGLLYNWNAVKTGKLAPKGWHIPTDAEWQTLVDYLVANGYNYDGSKTGNKVAKALGNNKDWGLSDIVGTLGNNDYPDYANKSGFSALPGGSRNWEFQFMGYIGNWWCSNENYSGVPLSCYIGYNMPFVTIWETGKEYGLSVRCIKD